MFALEELWSQGQIKPQLQYPTIQYQLIYLLYKLNSILFNVSYVYKMFNYCQLHYGHAVCANHNEI